MPFPKKDSTKRKYLEIKADYHILLNSKENANSIGEIIDNLAKKYNMKFWSIVAIINSKL